MFERAFKISCDRATWNVDTEEIGPGKLAEGRPLLGEAARSSEGAGQTPERIIDKGIDHNGYIAIGSATAHRVEGVAPTPSVKFTPEFIRLKPRQVCEGANEDLNDPFVARCTHKMVSIQKIEPALRTADDGRNGQLSADLLKNGTPAVPLATDF